LADSKGGGRIGGANGVEQLSSRRVRRGQQAGCRPGIDNGKGRELGDVCTGYYGGPIGGRLRPHQRLSQPTPRIIGGSGEERGQPDK